MHYKRMAIAVVAAFAPMLASAELVRCTSKNGASVIRRDKCDSPDDIRTPVTAKAPVSSSQMPPPRGADDAMAAYQAKDYARAQKLFEERALQGDALAQLMLGDIYKNGRGVPKDEAMGFFWTRKAAEQGDPRGQAALAALMQAGRGTPRDDAGAIPWLEKSAKQGYSLAQAALGSAFMQGRGTRKDELRGMQWMEKAAESGDAQAQLLVGLGYHEGQPNGWPKDRDKALGWLRKSAAQGNADAAAAVKHIANAR